MHTQSVRSRALALVAVALSLAALGGCATTGFTSDTGAAAISFYRESVGATEHAKADKTGTACTTNILGVIAIGDASIEAAKRAGGVKIVASVDRDITNVFGIFGRNCTVVTGSAD